MKCPKCNSENITVLNGKLDCECCDCDNKFNYEIDEVFKGNVEQHDQAKELCKIMCN